MDRRCVWALRRLRLARLARRQWGEADFDGAGAVEEQEGAGFAAVGGDGGESVEEAALLIYHGVGAGYAGGAAGLQEEQTVLAALDRAEVLIAGGAAADALGGVEHQGRLHAGEDTAPVAVLGDP